MLARWVLISPDILEGLEATMVEDHDWTAGWLWGMPQQPGVRQKARILTLAEINLLQSVGRSCVLSNRQAK